MPIYEYRCQSCGSIFEVEQRITEPPLKIHNGCGGKVTRLISTSSFILKGSGWYKTDYASPLSSGKEKEGSKEKGGEKEEKSSATDSTPACGDHCTCASS